jgi:hypothetical protein
VSLLAPATTQAGVPVITLVPLRFTIFDTKFSSSRIAAEEELTPKKSMEKRNPNRRKIDSLSFKRKGSNIIYLLFVHTITQECPPRETFESTHIASLKK